MTDARDCRALCARAGRGVRRATSWPRRQSSRMGRAGRRVGTGGARRGSRRACRARCRCRAAPAGPLQGVPVIAKTTCARPTIRRRAAPAFSRLSNALRRDRDRTLRARVPWSPARETWTSSRWARRRNTAATGRREIRTTSSVFPAARAAGPRPRSPMAWRRSVSDRIPAAPCGSRRRFAACSVSSRRMGGCPGTAWLRSAPRSTRSASSRAMPATSRLFMKCWRGRPL